MLQKYPSPWNPWLHRHRNRFDLSSIRHSAFRWQSLATSHGRAEEEEEEEEEKEEEEDDVGDDLEQSRPFPVYPRLQRQLKMKIERGLKKILNIFIRVCPPVDPSVSRLPVRRSVCQKPVGFFHRWISLDDWKIYPKASPSTLYSHYHQSTTPAPLPPPMPPQSRRTQWCFYWNLFPC